MTAENASRLEAMERAEKNIEGMLVELNLVTTALGKALSTKSFLMWSPGSRL